MANHISHASLPYPIKNARYTIPVPYLDADGDPTDPTTPDTEISQDGGAYADATEEVTTITGSNGSGYITLTGSETNNSLVFVAAKVASGPKATLAILQPRNLPILESGTASAGAAGSITFASGTYTGINLTGCFVRTTGGTGGGGTGGANNQARRITSYNTSTRVATVTPNWETTPDNTTTYDILLPEGISIPMLTSLSPTVLARTLDVSSGGEAGLDWANIGSPTTTVNLSGTTVLLSAGTGAGQLDFTSGVVKANVTQNAGTNITASSGRQEVNLSHIAGSAVNTSSAQIGVNVVNFGGSAGTFASGRPEVNTTHFGGTAGTFSAGIPSVNLAYILGADVKTTTAQLGVNVVQMSGDSTAADNIEAAFDGTGGVTITAGLTGNITGNLSGSVGSVTGNVGGNVIGSVGSVAAGGITASSIAADAIGASELAADAIAEIADAVWDEARSGHVTAGTFGEYVLSNVTHWRGGAVPNNSITGVPVVDVFYLNSQADPLDIAAGFFGGYGTVGDIYMNSLSWSGAMTAIDMTKINSIPTAIRTGTAQAGSSNSITLDASASATNDFYNGATIYLTGGTGAGQYAVITDYVGATKVASVVTTWRTNPDNTTTFAIYPYGMVELQTAGFVRAYEPTVPGAVLANVYYFNDDGGGTTGVSMMGTDYWTDGYIDVNLTAVAGNPLGTSFAGYVPCDVRYINGASVNTSSAQLGVNIVNFGGVAGTFSGGRPEVNTTHAAGTAWNSGAITSSTFAAGAINASAIAADAIGSSELAADAVAEIADAVWDEVRSGHVTAGTFGEYVNSNVTHYDGVAGISYSGVPQVFIRSPHQNTSPGGNTSTTFVLDTSASSVDDYYNGSYVMIIDGGGYGQVRLINDYVGSTRTCTVDAWVTTPGARDYIIIPGYQIPSGSPPTAAAIADAVWDEARSGHVTAGSFGEYTPANVTHFGGAAGTFYAGSPTVIHRYAHQNISPGGNTSTTFVLDSSASSVDDFYNGALLMILSGSGHVGQFRIIKDYVGSTRTCTVDAWITTPTEKDYVILPNYGIPFASTGTQFTAIPWNAAWDAEVQSEVQDALEFNNLDHLLKNAVDTDFATTVHLNSVFGHIADNGTSPTFDRTLHSLEAIVSTSVSPSVIADAVWDESRAAHTAVGSFGEYTNANLTYINDAITGVTGLIGMGNAYDATGYLSANVTHFGGVAGTFNAGRPSVFTNLIRYNTAQAGASDSITLDAGASAVTDFYKNTTVYIVSGTGAGQHSVATAYNGTTKVLSVSPSWTVTPDNTSVFALSGIWVNSGSSSVTESSIATEIFTKLLTDPDFSTSGSFGKLVKDNLNATISSRAVPGDAMTLTSGERGLIADKFLVRNLATGFDGGTNTVRNALRPSVNLTRFDVPSYGKYTVYEEDGITPAFIGTYSRGPSGTGPLESSGAD